MVIIGARIYSALNVSCDELVIALSYYISNFVHYKVARLWLAIFSLAFVPLVIRGTGARLPIKDQSYFRIPFTCHYANCAQ